MRKSKPSRADAWRDVLEAERAKESWRGVHLVIHSPELRDLVAVWPVVCVGWVPPRLMPPRLATYAWERCWPPAFLEAVTVELCKVLRWDWAKASSHLASAVAMRLVYPDGTAHKEAEDYVERSPAPV